MQLQAMKFMDEQERLRVRKYGVSNKLREEVQGVKRVPREAVVDGCGECMVGEAMEQFTMEGIDHMEWDAGSDQFIKTSPQVLPLI